jgi:hypothetical protein
MEMVFFYTWEHNKRTSLYLLIYKGTVVPVLLLWMLAVVTGQKHIYWHTRGLCFPFHPNHWHHRVKRFAVLQKGPIFPRFRITQHWTQQSFSMNLLCNKRTVCTLSTYQVFGLVCVCNSEASTHATINQEGTSPGSKQPKASFLPHSVPWVLDTVARKSGCISGNCS